MQKVPANLIQMAVWPETCGASRFWLDADLEMKR